MRKWSITYLFLFLSGFFLSQNYRVGSIPSFTCTYKISTIKLVTNLQSRQIGKEKDRGNIITSKFYNERYDMSFLISKKVSFKSSFTVGYLFRILGSENYQRFIQQYSWISDVGNTKFAHRVSSDQTFKEIRDVRWRFRYRFGGAIPLNGQNIDPNEFYVKYNVEHLSILEKGIYDMEYRLSPFIGFEISNNSKVEFGMDYRLDEIINSTARHNYWWRVNWYINL